MIDSAEKLTNELIGLLTQRGKPDDAVFWIKRNLFVLEKNIEHVTSPLFIESCLSNFFTDVLLTLEKRVPLERLGACVIALTSSDLFPRDFRWKGDVVFCSILDRLPGGRTFDTHHANYASNDRVARDWKINIHMREKLLQDHFKYTISREQLISNHIDSSLAIHRVSREMGSFGNTSLLSHKGNAARLTAMEFYFEHEEDEMMMRLKYP